MRSSRAPGPALLLFVPIALMALIALIALIAVGAGAQPPAGATAAAGEIRGLVKPRNEAIISSQIDGVPVDHDND